VAGKYTSEIVSIVSAGGGVIIDGDKYTSQLVTIATAAAKSGARVIIKGSSQKYASQLVSIATAGKGRVIFDLTDE
jgi:hypothetical protein